MASGWGINGNKGRCFDFWTDFSECMSRCREPKDCALLREDYLECLHHGKEELSEGNHSLTEFRSHALITGNLIRQSCSFAAEMPFTRKNSVN
ncbi:unnamed protein product [Victoria cruziana]